MIIKLSQSMSVGCLVSPLDYEDILAQEKRLEELTSAHGEAIRALAEYRTQAEVLYRDNVALSETADRLREVLERLLKACS